MAEASKQKKILGGVIVIVAIVAIGGVASLLGFGGKNKTSCKDSDKYVIDEKSSVCYAIPASWEVTDDLKDGYTSGIDRGADNVILVGPVESFLSDEDLADLSDVASKAAELIAKKYDALGTVKVLSKDSETVGGLRVGTASVEFDGGSHGTYVRASFVELENGDMVAMVGATLADKDHFIKEVDKAHDSFWPEK